MANEKGTLQDGIVRKLVFSVLRYWYVFVTIIFIAGTIGFFYAKTLKPVYTISCQVAYKAEDLNKDENGYSYSDVSLSKQFYDTFIIFSSSGNVIERANFYYDEFIKSGEREVQNYVDMVNIRVARGEDTYPGTNTVGNKDIMAQKLGVYAKGDGACVLINYTDDVAAASRNKAKILILSIGIEANVKQTNSNTSVYFGDAKIILNDLSGGARAYGYVDKKGVVITFAGIGLAVSCVVVYAIYALNRTVRSKEELERITGTSVLAYIMDLEG